MHCICGRIFPELWQSVRTILDVSAFLSVPLTLGGRNSTPFLTHSEISASRHQQGAFFKEHFVYQIVRERPNSKLLL